MSASEPDTTRLAERLREAERTRVACAPLTETDPGLTIAGAYAVQRENTRRRIAEGAIVRGRKVGLTSRAMQEMLGVDEPDFGVLFEEMLLEDGAVIGDELLQPRAEAEIGFLLRRPLRGPGVSSAMAAEAIAAAVATLEIIDSRVRDWQIRLADTIADNASSGRVVLGTRLLPLDRLDARLTGVVVTRNGELAETGAGAAVLGNPVGCVAWLANKLAEFGEGLEAGELILPGAMHRAVDLAPGDVVRAEFSGLGAVTVSAAPTPEGGAA
ncbi:fumarylacetoacetate hydrolase family protein [Conexibacter stalactiti]|uniref:Fumarylacetoacetate hydrolase family protein n=1 Tax=Conexibacter stalactiti TaxID=1940611 RepID=A0ABU4HL67_9ACTN|nr:fumarylacetoacetate hydrolase family protein [Conexibacter stalactiti]MDW5594047.1 fumarylacetoacetate hydrolase family protein [Conexibacter stalactiti]MEC5034689.1 fumarylacetoacetate hydrolase family protein [Conexibacter stalactiti]